MAHCECQLNGESGRESLSIEAACIADAAEILALQKLAFLSEAELYHDFDIPMLTQTVDALRSEIAEHTVLKAVMEGRIIGSVRGSVVGATCHIGRLMVHAERQGEGTGTLLMTAIEDIFPAVERFELFTGHKSLTNIRLYERLGSRVFRTEEVRSALSLVFMEKAMA
jgi:GNAT superfamily N-acetyltransferase